jgi:soluble lytic murein transglycosylase
LKAGLLALGLLTWTAPVCAQSAGPDPLAPLPTDAPKPDSQPPQPAATAPLPAQPAIIQPSIAPPQAVRTPRDWRGVFDAIDSRDWAAARAGIATLPPGILTPVVKAELYTANGSPTVDLGSLQSLLAEAPELPQAEQLARMAWNRGATTMPWYVQKKLTYTLGSAPVRYRAKPVQGEAAADQLRSALDALVKLDDAAGAEAQLLTYAPLMSVEARAEAGTRVAFVYYVLGLDLDARRVADTWRPGATGEWASQAAWISALASWRLGDCNSAVTKFQQVAQLSQQRELRAGGY